MEMIRDFILKYYQSLIMTIFFFLLLITFLFRKRGEKNESGGNIGTADGSSVCDSPYLDCSGGGGDGGA